MASNRILSLPVLFVALLTGSLLSWTTPGHAASPPQFDLRSAAILANGAEVKGTVTITCFVRSVDLYVILTQRQSDATTASRSIDYRFHCSGKRQTSTSFSSPYAAGTETRMHPGPATVELDYNDYAHSVERQRFSNITLSVGSLSSGKLENTAVITGRGGVLNVRATINCKPGGQYEPHALVSQPISSTLVQVGESAYDIYSGGPLLPCPHTPLTISVPVPGYQAPFKPGPAFVWLEFTIWSPDQSMLTINDFIGVVTATTASQSAPRGVAP